MSQVRRRRALRTSVLAASLAVLASFVVAPPAAAEDAPVTTTAPTTSSSPTDATSSPTTASPSTSGADAPSDSPSGAPVTSGAAPTTAAEPSEETPAPGETVVGELQQAWPDPTAEEHAHDETGEHDGHDDHSAEQPLSWIDTGDGTAVRVPTDALPDVAVGSTLAVTVGDQVVDEASAEQGFAPAVEVQSAEVVDTASADPTTASAGTTPTNTVTAVLVLPSGASPDGMTVSTFVNTLNGDVSSFWDEQSNGLVRISAVQGASGWVSSSKGCDAPFALWSDVARQIGWTEGAGKHLMLYVPGSASGCAYGLGTVGSSIGSGGYSYVRAARLSVMGHELGHNFGLGHSSELQCESSLESGTCRVRDYYDFYDIMGISWDQVGTLNAVQAARLGLLPSSEQVALTTSSAATTVSLAPVSAASGTRAVKLTAPNGAVYYLEYRQASGRDSWLGDSRNAYGLTSGVVLRRASSGGNTSLLLDGTPSTSSGWNGDMQQALPVGATVSVSGGAFGVTVTATSSSAATVVVDRWQTPIRRAYQDQGGSSGPLGNAVTDEMCGLAAGGCFQVFQGGSVYWSPASGAQVVTGAVKARWGALGWEVGSLGYPVGEAVCASGSGCVQAFQRGSLVSSDATGVWLVRGLIQAAWVGSGGGGGALGFPLTDEMCGLAAGGCFQVFQGGSVYWSPASGAHAVTAGIRSRWQASGWEVGAFGYPVAPARTTDGGVVQQQFQRGVISTGS